MKSPTPLVYCVIPNWNGERDLAAAIDSVLAQSQPCRLVIVDNGSTDGSVGLINKYGDKLDSVILSRNTGFAGGVNAGIKFALDAGAEYVALFNNDAEADKQWLEHLYKTLKSSDEAGIVTGKLLKAAAKPPYTFDSTGDFYSNWLLAFPRGRGLTDNGQYDHQEFVFSASGGASLYRAEVFKQIGLFDEAFFAYYEDVDLSFRAQLAGWKIIYQPKAVAYHQIGKTSGRIPGFTAYHTVKNVPLLWFKNLPLGLWWPAAIKFQIAYFLMMVNIARKGNLGPVLKGFGVLCLLLPAKLLERLAIQRHRKVPNRYIRGILYPDLPPDRHKLRKLRARVLFWRHYEDSN